MTTDRSGRAAALYANTHNCAQTLLEVFADEQTSATKRALIDSAAGLGGGLASQGLTCGAMIGGLMALNLHLVQHGVPDEQRSAALKELAAEFRRRNQRTDCAGLTGMNFDSATLERCRGRVVEVVEYAESMLAQMAEAKP